MTRHFLTLIFMMFALVAFSQNTTRKNLKLKKAKTELTVDSAKASIKHIRISGYEKAQRSTTETMFVTNRGATDFYSLNITLTYFDENGRQLHERTETVDCYVPAGETRSIAIKAWDRQQLWYYQKSQAKHNAYCTPYDVKVRVNYVER